MMEDQRKKPLKILFVDDEENVLRALKRLFIDEDFDIFTANSGREGLILLKDHETAVIVSDQKMPEMTGAEFLEKSRDLSPNSVRIVLTGYADVTAAVDAINKGGAYRYVTKPWNDREFILTVKDAAEKYHLTRENLFLTELSRRQNEELKQWNAQLEIMVQEQTIDIQNRNKDLQRLNDQLRKNFRKAIETFSSLLEIRDKSLSNHSKNVASLARRTSRAMSLTEKEMNDIHVAAMLHDIGKIGAPDAVLLKKPADYNDYERKEYRYHPVRGQVAVAHLDEFHDIGLMIRHHHECADGTGFADGLKGSSIPLGSRIIAMADALDRIANDRSSGVKNNYYGALEEIESRLGTKFDAAIFPHFKQAVEEKIKAAKGQDFSYEIEMHPGRLAIGMVLSRDVRSGSGMLILAQGVVLEQKMIAAIQRYYEIDPPSNGIFIIRTTILHAK